MNFRKQIEFKIKEAFFWLFRIFLKKGNPDFTRLDREKLQKILVLRPDRIGDSVCSLPLIDGLIKGMPKMRLSIFASTKNFPLIKDDPRFDEIFIYRRNILRDIREVMAIRRRRFDCIIDLLGDDSVTTLILSQLCAAGAPRIGLGKKKHKIFYDYSYDPGENSEDHIIDINLKLLEVFGLQDSPAERHAPPYVTDDAQKKMDDFLETLRNDKADASFIGFNLSARGENRDWGYEKSRQLIRKILDEHKDCYIILITTPSERFKGDRLEADFDAGVVQIPPNANLVEVSALLSRLDLLTSPDTSLVHIARSFGVPVLGLYTAYRNIYQQWRPFNQEGGLVLSYGADDVFNITVDQVFEEFTKMIHKKFPVKNI